MQEFKGGFQCADTGILAGVGSAHHFLLEMESSKQRIPLCERCFFPDPRVCDTGLRTATGPSSCDDKFDRCCHNVIPSRLFFRETQAPDIPFSLRVGREATIAPTEFPKKTKALTQIVIPFPNGHAGMALNVNLSCPGEAASQDAATD